MSNIYTHGWKVLICLIIAFIQTNTEAYASHAQGGDLTYECLGGNQYRLRLSFYRDCIGNDAPFNVDINIQSQTCGFDFFETALPIAGTGQEITPICPSDSSTCKGGIYTGIQEWIYE